MKSDAHSGFLYRLELSQEELAERADFHRTYITGIERGARNITLKALYRLARALGVSPADLVRPPAETPIATGGSPLQREHEGQGILKKRKRL